MKIDICYKGVDFECKFCCTLPEFETRYNPRVWEEFEVLSIKHAGEEMIEVFPDAALTEFETLAQEVWQENLPDSRY